MPRPRNTDARRRQIVDALARVMTTTSYAEASVNTIAREAGLTSGLVHYHFANKQAVLVALVERLVEGLEARHAARLAAAADTPWARLDAFIDAFTALDDDADPAAVTCWTRLGDEASRRPDVAVPYRAAIARWHAALTERITAVLIEAGRAAADAPARAAGLMAAIEGAFHLSAAAPGVIPAGQAAPMIKRMARGLIAEAPPAAPPATPPPAPPSEVIR